MPALLPNVDPDGLLEYSVVYTDRSLNHMSNSFQSVMCDISRTLKEVYNAHSAVVVPGSGTFAMEAVARQFARDQTVLVIRNGWFSYRWTQIMEMANLPASATVLKASRNGQSGQSPFSPAPIENVIETIKRERPAVVFAPHVETSAGMILPDSYIKQLSDAAHSVGALVVIDCIASGTVWLDMQACGIDVLISAPQKGWSGPPCAGLAMLSERARKHIDSTSSDSFACDLKKWLQIMEAYENGGHAYHATMPTESLRIFRDVMEETRQFGFENAKTRQIELGKRVRSLLTKHGLKSVSASEFEAPGVVVCYTSDSDMQNGKKFSLNGMQIAAGVPLMCDEGDDYASFRLGLFGLDKLMHIDRTVNTLAAALSEIVPIAEPAEPV